MVLIEPEDLDRPILNTEQITRAIDKNASDTALILLSAVQFYTGQYFDIERITAYAHSKGILIGWDCAHAAGNVDLRLHDWDVDFAAWCSYKYLNSGPGGMAALFVHERHGRVDEKQIDNDETFRPRLAGWWGGDPKTRFNMDNSMKLTHLTMSQANSPRFCPTTRRSRIPALESVCPRYQRCRCITRNIQPRHHAGNTKEVLTSHRLPRTSAAQEPPRCITRR